MITRYKMNILTKDKTFTFEVRVLPVYEWDSILGFSQNEGIKKLNNLEYLRAITDLMIKPGFLDEFYFILNENREYITYYKDYLKYILYSIQFDVFKSDPDFKKPTLVYLSHYLNNADGFVQFDYINDSWNYEQIIQNIKSQQTSMGIQDENP
ncbi:MULTISPECIES: DUF1473 family protein [Borrelia]|uniref:Uncharacterized protein n=5 Tax=Borrelia TaxID=138 RepID=A0AAN1CFP8_BORHE|nr:MULTISPECIES: DUF1473 family protein [Borrelia]AHH03894.1 Hypothetical protein BHY_0943 [Borrelia nietonii YOR]AHH13230.1 Hypothetical protein BHO_0009200 [Borrelia hermsii YBT]AHH14422.1 Hypothetical protein BHW_0009200 [Borrelia hermsii MTW]AMR76198.1 hypothetical protein A0V01_06325 [Borrelia hermsii]ANA43813.1 hypothetical protein AXX13_P09 [Borrelia hermsii HS1]